MKKLIGRVAEVGIDLVRYETHQRPIRLMNGKSLLVRPFTYEVRTGALLLCGQLYKQFKHSGAMLSGGLAGGSMMAIALDLMAPQTTWNAHFILRQLRADRTQTMKVLGMAARQQF